MPKKFHRALFGLTLRRRGYMHLAAQVLIGWKMKKPVAVAYEDGWPVGWMFFDPIDKDKLEMYVSRAYRKQGIARRMAVALKKKYPHRRFGVYTAHAAGTIRGLSKPMAHY